MRVDKIRILTGILFLILTGGVFYLQIVKGGFYYSLSVKNCIRVMPLEGIRGRIMDSSGRVLVDNQMSYNIAVIPYELKKNPKTISELAGLLNKSVPRIKKEIEKGFISSFSPIIVVKDADKKTAILIEENKFRLPGVTVRILPKRQYPYYDLAGHVIGYLGKIDSWRITRLRDYGYKSKDVVGFGGIEESLEPALRSKEGGTQIQVDHRGRMNKIISFRPSLNGQDVYLTIDIRIQKIVEEALINKKGAAVLMEPESGKIIALASSPGFYPGAFLEEGNSVYVQDVFSNPDSPMINRVISGQYPLGSVFKAVSAAAALEKKKIVPARRFFCPGKLSVGIKEFNCWSRHDSQDIIEAVTHSCNVYFYHLALLLGPDILTDYALKFGLGRQSGIDLPYEASGYVPSVSKRKMKLRSWYDGDTANFGIGQGDLLVTPLQSARLMAVFANGGKLVKPYIVGRIGPEEIKPEEGADLGIAQGAIKAVNEGLRRVVNSETGTANIGSWGNLKVAGKTGTAQVYNKLSHGWFSGFLPYDKPRIAFCVFLENTGMSIHSVVLANQIFSRLREEKLI